MPAIYDSTGQIYSQLLGQCESMRFEGPWTGLRIGIHSLATLGDAEHALTHLQQNWDERDLIDSGLLRRTDGRAAIAKRLACEGPLLALRAAKDQRPFEVVGARGNLSYRGIPLLCALDDFQTKKQLQASRGNLFLTSEIWDAAVLRALGLPAITATGLAAATIPNIEDLALRFGWKENGSADENEQNTPTEGPLRLIVVGWRVSTLDSTEPGGLPDLAALLVQFERHMQLDLQDVGIWRPIETDLERARFLLERNEFNMVRDGFIASAADCCRSLTSFLKATGDSTEFVDALQRLREISEGRITSHSPEAARRLYGSAVDRELIEPLIRRALSTTDPYRRNLTAMAADISRMFFELMPETLAAHDHISGASQQRLRQQLELSGRFVAILNVLKEKK